MSAETVEKYKVCLLYVRRPRVLANTEATCPKEAAQKAMDAHQHLQVKPVAAYVSMPDKTILAFRFKKSGVAPCPPGEVEQFNVDEVRKP